MSLVLENVIITASVLFSEILLIMFNQSHKISENNTAVLIITFLNTKDTIIRVIIGLVK